MALFQYYRGYKDPHRGLRFLRLLTVDIPDLKIIKVPMHVPTGFVFRSMAFTKYTFKLFAHLLLIKRIWIYRNKNILVREFLTLPLLLVAPFLLAFKCNVWFLCHHNIATAAKKRNHRIALRCMRLLGIKFIVFETVRSWSIVEEERFFNNIKSIPFPIFPYEILRKANKKRGKITIGFVGNFRKEKLSFNALDMVVANIESDILKSCTLIIGTPEVEKFEKYSNVATLIDTQKFESYLSCLKQCDLIVLPYSDKTYSFRTSGVLADAVSFGCFIVCPNLPILSDQVSNPVPVGICYHSEHDFINNLSIAIDKLKDSDLSLSFTDYISFRSPKNIKKIIEDIIYTE